MKKRTVKISGLVVLVFAVVIAGVWGYNKYKWNKAKELYRTANYTELAKQLKDSAMPSGQEELNIYARTMMTIGEYDKAYTAFSKMYEIDKSNDTKLIMGNALMQKQDLSGAERIYNEILQQNPNFIQAALNLASIYRTQNKTEQANETLTAALKSNPNSVQLYEYLISINTPASASEYNSWVEELKKLDPNNSAIPK
ncbi:MAG: tetratricopeptide repeat protein [Chloroflexi bacterium]|nr:tetratricopeptide repeat protein [Chloroflexota bacterium]